MADVLPVPLIPGIRQDVDRTMLPPGSLVRAENCRLRRGALARRQPMINAGTNVAQYIVANPSDYSAAGTATSAPAIGGYLSELAEVGGNQALITGARAYLRGATGFDWIEGGRCSRALPVKAHWVQYDDSVQTGGGNTMASGVGQVACATLPGYTAVTYERVDAKAGSKQCCLVVYDLAGIVVLQFTAGEDGLALGGRQNPRVIASGGKFLWFYQQADGNPAHALLYVRKVDPPLRSITAENGFFAATNAGEGYDVSAFNTNEVLVAIVMQSPSRILVSRRLVSTSNSTPGTWPTINSQIITMTSTSDALVSIYGDTATSQIWVAYVAVSGNEARAAGYDVALAGTVSNLDLTAAFSPGTDLTAYAAPSVTARANGSVWCAITTYRAFGAPSVTSYQTLVARLDLGGSSPSSYAHILHTHLASRLFNGTSTSFQVWTHTDSGVTPNEFFGSQVTSFAWRYQRRYSLCTVAVAVGDTGQPEFAVLQPELTPDELSSKHGMRGWLPEVALRTSQQDENGNLSTHGFVPVLVPIRMSNDLSHDSLAVLMYEWEDFTPGTATARRIIEHAAGGLIVGGDLQELPLDMSNRRVPPVATAQFRSIASACRGFQNGFQCAPAILSVSVADDPSASLVGGAVYQFVAVFEQIDDRGRRHRSAQSNRVSLTVPDATTKVSLIMASPTLTDRSVASSVHSIVVHVYATQGNGSIFYRVTPNSGAPLAWDTSYTDLNVTWVFQGAVDADIPGTEILYVQGGVKPNQPAPAHRFAAVGNGRVMLGGLFDPRMVEVSKYERPLEPAQFTRDAAFRTMLPERCTGLAFMDGNFVAFTRRGIYLIPGGSLPNDQGAPALSTPTRLPSTVGCIDWRSIVEVPDGLMFQSRRGIYLLPRGFGQPVLMSAQVQNELQGRIVVSTCVVDDPGQDYGIGPGEVTADRAPGQHLVIFSIFAPDWIGETDGKLLVFDLDRRIWVSVDDTGAKPYFGAAVASWGGRLAIASRVQLVPDIRAEFPGAWDIAAADTPMRLSVADLRPFGVTTMGGMTRVQVLGELRSTKATLSCTPSFGGQYSKATALKPQKLTGTAGDKFIAEWSLPVRRNEALGVDLEVSSGGPVANEGLTIHALGVEVLPPAGRASVGSNRRAA